MSDLISRAAVLEAIEALQRSPWYGDEKDTAYHYRYLTRKEAVEIVRDLAVNSAPAVDAAPVVRCRDCKHYEIKDLWGYFKNMPILAASDVPTCHKWGDGECKTSPDGYCFLGEWRDSNGTDA